MKIDREVLLAALTAVQPGIAKALVVEQATCFVFLDGLVCTFNNEVAVSHPLAVDFDGAVPGKEFYDFIKKLKIKEVELTVGKQNDLLVKAGRSKVTLRLEEDVKLPLDELGLPEDEDYTDLPTTFIDAVSSCIFSVGKDVNKPILSYLHVKDTFIESSDNYRITRFGMGKTKAFPERLLIPSIAAKNIVEYKPVEYALTDGWVHFRNKDEALFSCRILEDAYPDFSNFLKVKGDEIEFPSDLDEILDRASVFCVDQRVKVSLEKGKLTVSTESANGNFVETVRIKYEGASTEFYMHPQFMRDTLKLNKKAIIGKALKFSNDNFEHVVRLIPTDEK